MKFSVLCPELRAGASQKSLKYDITKGQTLEQHIANIHRSLDLVGVELSRPPSSYALQVADRKGEPLLLDGVQFLFEDGMVDGCLQTIAEVAKRQRLRDLSVLLVPTPLVRAQELIAGLSHGDTVKESAYKLRSCLQVRAPSSLWRRMCGYSYRMLSMGYLRCVLRWRIPRGRGPRRTLFCCSASYCHICLHVLRKSGCSSTSSSEMG